MKNENMAKRMFFEDLLENILKILEMVEKILQNLSYCTQQILHSK